MYSSVIPLVESLSNPLVFPLVIPLVKSLGESLVKSLVKSYGWGAIANSFYYYYGDPPPQPAGWPIWMEAYPPPPADFVKITTDTMFRLRRSFSFVFP